MPYRYLTSLVVRHRGALYMFDAGEGTQIALKRATVGIKNLRVLALSHLHGDHCLGIPGILMMRGQVDDPAPLTILGPPGTEGFLTQVRGFLGFHINFPVRYVEWGSHNGDQPYRDELVSISWAPLKHTTLCLGYRLEEHQRPGKFNPEAARRLGVPQGPLWGRLQRGEEILLDQERTVGPDQVLGPPRRGRSICYGVDTVPSKGLYRICGSVDLAFLDGMFLPEHAQDAKRKGHMTAEDAARVAARAGVRELVLVHLSPRYKEEPELLAMEKAARERHPRARVGRDLAVYQVQLPD